MRLVKVAAGLGKMRYLGAWGFPPFLGCREVSRSPSHRGHQGWAGVELRASRIAGAPHSFPGYWCVRHGAIFRVACVRMGRSLETLVDRSQGLWYQILRPSRLLICMADRPGNTKTQRPQEDSLHTSQPLHSLWSPDHCRQASCQFPRESFHLGHWGVQAPHCVGREKVTWGSRQWTKQGASSPKDILNRILRTVKYQPTAS